MKGTPRIPKYPHRRNVESIAHGWCFDCPWITSGRGALARAAGHARWSRHRVRTAQTIVTLYRPRGTNR